MELENVELSQVATEWEIQSHHSRRALQMHIVASGAAGVAYGRLRDGIDSTHAMRQEIADQAGARKNRLAHNKIQMRLVASEAAGLVASMAAQAERRIKEAQLEESHNQLCEMAKERDTLVANLAEEKKCSRGQTEKLESDLAAPLPPSTPRVSTLPSPQSAQVTPVEQRAVVEHPLNQDSNSWSEAAASMQPSPATVHLMLSPRLTA
jgi:hypothetical protein